MAMYATHLATGSNLHCKTVKSSTIATYLHNVSTFIGRFRPIDPRFVSAADTRLAPAIRKVLDEQKRWETVPNRREPFTLELQKLIADLPTVASDPCCLDAAMANWTVCALYGGCRGIEWAQTNAQGRHMTSYFRNQFGRAYAFTPEDIQCFTASSWNLTLAQALQNPSLVGRIKLRFDEQKNAENGEWRLFTRNHEKPEFCFIANMMAILARHNDLTNSHQTHPLSVYRASNGVVYNITTADVEIAMRRAAATLYNLDPVKNQAQLALWSSHSLRVGACTTLYSQGFSEMEIKFLLRWKSSAFMIYLRNLAVTSRRHNLAMNASEATPNFV